MALSPTDRRKPFTKWVKKLNQKMKRTKGLNNPYPQSGRVSSRHTQAQDDDRPESQSTRDPQSTAESRPYTADLAVHSANELSVQPGLSRRNRGGARLSVDVDGRPPTTAPSYAATSYAGTNITATDPRRPDSTFSSPAPSARSIATTLSTIQSQMANGPGLLNGQANNLDNTDNHASSASGHDNDNNAAQRPASRARQQPQAVQYTQPEALVTAMPASDGDRNRRSAYRPATYSAIIANNLLNDNISILTLASSTQRRRRRSWDTDYDHASVRALPPASQFGGSRESLPLSVLSSTLEGQPTSPGLTAARSIAERSVTGLTTGHGRADSLNGSIGGGPVMVASES